MTCVSNTMYKVEWNTISAPAPIQDTTKPVATLSLINKNLTSNQVYSANIQVSGTDASSAVNKIEVFISEQGYAGWYKTFSWSELTSAKHVTKNFEIKNLKYNTTYSLYANVYDSAGNVQTVYLSSLRHDSVVYVDTDNPIATLNVEHKNLKTNNFDLTMKVGGSDASSPVTRMEVYSYGYGYNGQVFAWDDQNSNAKQVSKAFTLSNLIYNKLYNFYAKVFDKTGKSSVTHLTNVSAPALMPTCASTISGYGYYTLCPNQLVTYAGMSFTNIYASSNLLIVKINNSQYLNFSLGEEKVLTGANGVQVKVKFNSVDQQQNASIIISQA
ncbi:MAG: hypothetical protein HYV41_03875 [Candidatus Magasanikbacteria bacterium]|nr:hypothetical protein [Candidatus Magasanikbacteria bacterium]